MFGLPFKWNINFQLMYIYCQSLVVEGIRRQPWSWKIAGSIPIFGRFATPFSKESQYDNADNGHTSDCRGGLASCLG